MRKTLILALLLVVFGTGLVACEYMPKFTVSFYSEGVLFATQTVAVGEQVSFPDEVPTKESDEKFDYIFKGWSTSPNVSETIGNTMVTGDLNLYAVFTPQPKDSAEQKTYFTVTFVDGLTGERIGEPQQVEAGADAVLPEVPDHTDQGYVFKGWDISHENIKRTLTITAQYERGSVTLTRHYLGQTREETLDVGGEIELSGPTIPQSLVFDGWFFDEDFLQPVEGAMPAADSDIYAKINVDFSAATLTAGGELVYGNENAISVSGLAGSDILSYDFKWADGATEQSVSLGSAGTHSLSVTVTATYTVDDAVVLTDETTITRSFDVAKASLTATIKASNNKLVYGNVPTLTVSYDGFIEGDDESSVTPNYIYNRKSGEGEVAVSDEERERLGAGEYTVTANFDSQNYQVSSVNKVDFTIDSKEVTIKVEASDFTYGDDLNGDVLPKAVVDEKELVYGDKADDFKAAITYTTQADKPYTPQGVFDVGNYYAKIESHPSGNYKVNTTSASFKVDKRKVNITAKAEDITYGETPELTYTTDKDILERDKDALQLVNKVTKDSKDFTLDGKFYPVGEYSFTIGFDKNAADKNYEISVTAANFKVEKAQLTATFTLTNTNLTYGQKPEPKLTFTGFVDGESESVIGESAKTFTYQKDSQDHDNTKFEVGEYTVIAPEINLQNYEVKFGSDDGKTLTFSVNKKTLTAKVTLTNDTITYGDKPTANITYGDFAYGEGANDIGTPTVVYTKANSVSAIIDDYSNGDKLSAGSYTATIDGINSTNYDVKVENAALTVNKKDLTVTVAADGKNTLTFGDKISLSAHFDGFIDGENEGTIFSNQDKTVKVYNGSSNVARGIASEVELPAYGFYNVGSYTATVGGLTSDNYEIKYSDFNFTVSKYNVTIAPTAANVKWSAGWKFEPKFDKNGESTKFNNFEFETKIEIKTQTQGTYNANSDASFNQSFKWVNGDESDANSYKIVYHNGSGNIDVSNDFSVTYNITVTLNNSVFTVEVPKDTNLTYDGEKHEFNITVTADKEDDQDVEPTIQYEVESKGGLLRAANGYTTTVPELINAGEYTVYYKVSAEHYDDLTGEFTVTINKANNEITTQLQDSIFTYDAKDHKYSLTAEAKFGTVSVSTNDNRVVSLMAESKELTVHNVGTYTITFEVAGTENYNEISKTITITVDKANYTVTNADDQTYTYNGHTQGHEITVEAVGGDKAPEVTYSLEKPSLLTSAVSEEKKVANAGTYTIDYTVDGGENYNTASGKFHVTIDPKQLTVSEGTTTATYGTQITFPEVEGFENGENAVSRSVNYRPFVGNESSYSENQTNNAGTYTVTYTVNGNNYTFNDGEETEIITITINKADGTLTQKSEPLPTYTYNGDEQTVDLVKCYTHNGDGTVTCSNNTFTDVPENGTLTVTVVLSDTNNYDGDQTTATVTVNKADYEGIADPTFDDIYMGFGPDGAPKALKNISFDNDNWHWEEGDTVIHVGSNSANAIYYENSKRNNYNDIEKQLTLNAIKEKIQVVANNGGQDYDSQKTTISADMFEFRFLNHEEKPIDNWEKYFELTLSQNVNFSLGGTYPVSVNISFKNENSINYADYFELDKTSLEVMFKVKTVEYNGTLYTIEDALNVADSGTITVKYNTSFADKETAEKIGYIVSGVPNSAYYTVKEGVTLYLPYGDGKTAAHETTTTIQFASAKPDLCHVYLEITDNITLTNRGHITIGGITTGGSGGKLGAGQTASNYAQITMGSNAKIESYGDIEAYGFIREKTEKNGSQVDMKEGTLTEPFIVLEHRGGSVFLGMAGGWSAVFGGMNFKTSPFIRYYLENVSTELTVEQAAKLNGHANLFANNADNETDVKLIGNNSDYLIQLLDGSYVKAKYDTNTKITELNTYGNWNLNSLSLTVDATITKVTISMDKTFFPISYFYHITLNAIDNTPTTVNASKQDLKLYPGAELTIGKNVTLTTKNLAIYDSAYTDPSVVSPDLNYPKNYPDGDKGVIGDAKVTISGTLNAQAIGGKVLAGEDGATVKAVQNSITVYELGTGSGTSVKYTDGETLYFQGHTDNSETWTKLDANTTYTAKDNKWVKDQQ